MSLPLPVAMTSLSPRPTTTSRPGPVLIRSAPLVPTLVAGMPWHVCDDPATAAGPPLNSAKDDAVVSAANSVDVSLVPAWLISLSRPRLVRACGKPGDCPRGSVSLRGGRVNFAQGYVIR